MLELHVWTHSGLAEYVNSFCEHFVQNPVEKVIFIDEAEKTIIY